MPDYSKRVDWISGESVDVWNIHTQATHDAQTDKDVIVLSVGDPDFSTPQPIIDRAIRAMHEGDTHYADVRGRMPLRRAIANHMHDLGGPAYQPDNIVVLAGTQNALFTASLCLLSPADEVLVLEPMYVTYEAVIQVSGATLVPVACDEENGFRLVEERLEKAVSSKTKAIVFSNPNNPTGTVFGQEELEAIANFAQRHDLWVIADEVYGELTFEQPHIPLAGLPNMAERTVTVSGVSKSHAMTGWRSGWLAGPKELAHHAENLALCMLYGLPGFIQEAVAYALKNCAADVARMREIYRSRRDIVVEALQEVEGIQVVPPQAGMFILIDTRPCGLSAAQFTRQLYETDKVSLLDAAAFGRNTKNFARLSFASGEAELAEACRRIKKFVEDLTP